MAESSDRYLVPAGRRRVMEEIRRSRFIATAAPADSVRAAQRFIEEVRGEFADATHNCWAFLAGPPGSSGQVGMSDDGEPHGSAGRPMLNALTHGGVGDVAVVVTRYYGGVKLGKGGLVRAYGGSVKQVLAELDTVEKIRRRRARIQLGYALVAAARRAFDEHEVVVHDETYAADVAFSLDVPVAGAAAFAARMVDLTGGGASLEWDEPP